MRDEYNKTATRDNRIYDHYIPDNLRSPLGALRGRTGRVGGDEWFDFVNPETIISFDDPKTPWDAHGAVDPIKTNDVGVDREKAKVVMLAPSAGLETLFHEAAHSDSYLTPDQIYGFGGRRMYPGYGEVVRMYSNELGD